MNVTGIKPMPVFFVSIVTSVVNKLFRPGVFALMLPNVFYDFTKVLMEKYFLWKMRHGYSNLP